ncbi:hypothetical protein K1T71_005178 [Dendrolimus kikuchii]|uniref:Uncharacterized protein n=1 Tax=Dendrolimus kikuchii TaxID=765133 RepID=A0ACC1D6M6_9NEOP|nr:hypothetical protein K1T71_005178 [Dendrolimus kikuchii]
MSSGRAKVPPEGGYGWVVTFAYGLNNVVVLPLIAGFALVFQEGFDEVGLTPTQGSLVIILNHSIGMLLSFFGGPVLKKFGYRKVAAFGALCVSFGLVLTSVSNTFWLFIIAYSIINSMGIAAVMAAFTLAINSFFKETRGRAIGIGMSLTGLGTICMPLLMDLLMQAYGWRYAILILSAICLHSLVAACLLRPAKWYLKDAPLAEELAPLNEENRIPVVNGISADAISGRLAKNVSMPHLNEPVQNGVVSTKSFSTKSLPSNASIHERNAVSHPDIRNKTLDMPLADTRYKWWESQEINLASSINIFDDSASIKKSKLEKNNKEKVKKSIFERFVEFFDLTLVTDPIFVNILFGLSIAACVETNFSLLLPIILRDMLQFESNEIAKLMSLIGLSDTMFRILAPFIGEWCHKPPRVMYMVSLLLIIFIRTIMLFTTSFTGMIFVALALGISKSVRTVYMNIVIPSYVPIERLAFASGIQMFFNGITIFTLGSILGRIRDSSGSYVIPIVVINIVTFITVVLWSAEFLYFRLKEGKSTEQNGA